MNKKYYFSTLILKKDRFRRPFDHRKNIVKTINNKQPQTTKKGTNS